MAGSRSLTTSRPLALALSIALAALALAGLQLSAAPPSNAAVASNFNPGNIISDPVFHDSGSLSAGAVQSFLSDRVANCGVTTCLRNYTEDTWTRTDSTGVCSVYTGVADESAATIITKVGQACRINPKVLIVLLEKEQGLVTATSPSSGKFQKATGFGCPDTAPCSTQYYGFFNQVYLAARQFGLYGANPTRYGYQAGRSNYIQWNPNSGCGGSQVYIANTSTAALYNYTPYQPNAAAMKNLYGSGDSCSAYGNRNFWRLFTDWFGSPQSGGFFVKGATDPSVYLVTPSGKLPVTSMAMITTFAPLGSIGTVSDSYLASLPTGPALSRLVTQPDGAIFLVDRGTTHYVGSCDLVADYGGDCSSIPQLSSVQVSDLANGSALTATFKSTNSPIVWTADGGVRHQVLDWASLVASGASTTITTLDPAVAASMRYGKPVAPDDIVVTASNSGQVFLLSPDGASLVPDSLKDQQPYAGLLGGSLEAGTIQAMGFIGTQTGAVTDGSTSWLLTKDGRRVAVDPGALAGLPARPWRAAVLAAAPTTGPSDPVQAAFVQAAGSGTIYRAAGGSARPVLSWPDLQALAGTTNPSIAVLPAATVAAMTKGATVLAPGAMVKTASAGEVFVLDGTTSRLHLPSFDVASALGLPALRTVPNGSLDGYAPGGDLSAIVSSSGTTSIGIKGALRALPAGTGLPATPVADSTIARLRTGAPLGSPVAVQERGSAAVWLVAGGAKRQASSWAALVKAVGTSSPTVVLVPAGTLAGLSTGGPVS